jgi:hypothetical protein
MVVLRDVIRVRVENKDKIDLKFYTNPDSFVLRFLYKHQEGSLWCFNRPCIDQQYFKEIPDGYGGTQPQKVDDSQERRFQEEDEENDVDLEKAMWLIVRRKKSINQVLKYFCPELQTATLRVRDIIKFGRVNFKITSLKCERLRKEYCGSCYMPSLNQMQTEEDCGSNKKREMLNVTEMGLNNDVSAVTLGTHMGTASQLLTQMGSVS